MALRAWTCCLLVNFEIVTGARAAIIWAKQISEDSILSEEEVAYGGRVGSAACGLFAVWDAALSRF